MRSRIALYLNDLMLDEILYFEEELDRRKEKYRKIYTVLSVQCDRRLQQGNIVPLTSVFARDCRRFVAENGGIGGGTLLGYSPDVSVLLFTSVESANRCCSSLHTNLAEFNGKGSPEPYRVSLKLGVATGLDVLSPGSVRCIHESVLVRRANQCGWKCPAGQILIDESSHREWPGRPNIVRMPFEIDDQPIYKLIPGTLGSSTERYDNRELTIFLDKLAGLGITLLKYDLTRAEMQESNAGASIHSMDVTELQLQAWDSRTGRNQTYSEKIKTDEFADRMETVKRMMSAVGIGLVRHALAIQAKG